MPDYFDLYDYQKEAVSFLVEPASFDHCGMSRFLALPPGAGKTPITACAMGKFGLGRVLIVCPPSIKDTWARQLVDWGYCQPSDIEIVRNGKQKIKENHITIVGYQMLLNEAVADQIMARVYHFLIVDEAHRLKTFTSKTTKLILGIQNKYKHPLASRAIIRYYLSGTPMPNRPLELFPILKTNAAALLGDKYDEMYKFGLRFCGAYYEGPGGKHGEWNFDGASNQDELAELIRPFFHYKTIEQILPDLPGVIYSNVYTDVGELEFDETNAYQATVRKCVGVAKIPFAIEYLKDRFVDAPGEKIICFVYHREVAEQIHKAFKSSSVLVYGGVSSDKKQELIDAFVYGDHKNLIIAQLNSAGEGIDRLQLACYNYVSVEPDWVPGNEDQMIGRLRRIGQRYPINAVRILASGTMDETVYGSSNRKRKDINKIFTVSSEKEKETMSLEQSLEAVVVELRNINKTLSFMVGTIVEGEESSVSTGVVGAANKGKGGRGNKKVSDTATEGTVNSQVNQAPGNATTTQSLPVGSPTPATATVGNAVPGAQHVSGAISFGELKDLVTAFIQLAQKLNFSQQNAIGAVTQILNAYGVSDLTAVENDPAKIQGVHDKVGAAYAQLMAQKAAAEASKPAEPANPLAALGLG